MTLLEKGFAIGYITFCNTIGNIQKESRAQRILTRMEGKFEKYNLVITDELCYISFDREDSELLFAHLLLRAGGKFTIMTTNLSSDRRVESFAVEIMTVAMIDRLTHKSYLLNMGRNSYWLKKARDYYLNF